MTPSPPQSRLQQGRGDDRFGLPTYDEGELDGHLIVIEGADGVGRSTQVSLLAPWIEVNGYAVEVTGWTRSQLVSDLIDRAKRETMVNEVTHALLYATDFADRVERTILPALRAGKVVVSDRYVHTALLRARVRGIDEDWLSGVYDFAPDPDATVELTLDAEELMLRTLKVGRLNYWESGMDQNLGDELHEAFMAYQSRMTKLFDERAERLAWHQVAADQPVVDTQLEIRRAVSRTLDIDEDRIYHRVEPSPPLDDAVWPAELTDASSWHPPDEA